MNHSKRSKIKGRRRILIIALLLSTNSLFAQTKQFTYGNQIWYGYYPQIRISKHWGLWNDWELHSKENFIEGVSQFVFRLAGTYYTNDNTKLTAGYGYTNNYPADNHLYISDPEHFFWEQVQWYSLFKKKRLMQWMRLEERFKRHIQDNYTLSNYSDFSNRARYEAYFLLPLSKEGITAHHFSLAMSDEIYINFGKKIVNNYFDQNRIFGGISYMINGNYSILLGYMNLFQQQPSGNQYKKLNVLRVSFYQNIETRHTKNKVPKAEPGI